MTLIHSNRNLTKDTQTDVVGLEFPEPEPPDICTLLLQWQSTYTINSWLGYIFERRFSYRRYSWLLVLEHLSFLFCFFISIFIFSVIVLCLSKRCSLWTMNLAQPLWGLNVYHDGRLKSTDTSDCSWPGDWQDALAVWSLQTVPGMPTWSRAQIKTLSSLQWRRETHEEYEIGPWECVYEILLNDNLFLGSPNLFIGNYLFNTTWLC